VASVGNVLAIAEYSQIEPRAAAYFSGDKRMIEAFIKAEDLHIEAPEAQAEQVKKLLAKIMVSVLDKLFKKQVPIEVDAKICESWGENEGICDVRLPQIRV
jgi:DNA polymerase I-like protein with 3'-5' exonuclease and polymerase domains